MRYLKQFSLILLLSMLGELLRRVIPLPVPAAIYGLVLMLLALRFRIFKVEQVQDTGHFLLSILSVLFIPSAVALLSIWPALRSIILPVLLISVVTTIMVMASTGSVTQWIMHWEHRRKK